jgi:hypothetical protein
MSTSSTGTPACSRPANRHCAPRVESLRPAQRDQIHFLGVGYVDRVRGGRAAATSKRAGRDNVPRTELLGQRAAGMRRLVPEPRHYCAVEYVRFYFPEADGGTPAAASLDEFRQHLRHCDLNTLDCHLTGGDFSRWVIGTLADHDLGADLVAIERDLSMHRASELERTRRTIDSIERRYLTPPDR